MTGPLVKMLLPLVEQQLTDEKASQLLGAVLEHYPVAAGGDKNVVVLSMKEGITYASVATVAGNRIVKVHGQQRLVEILKETITNL